MFAGFTTGMCHAIIAKSLWCGIDDDTQPWSSPATTSTPPCGDEPYALPCFSASPARSTPGPLPYHIAYTPLDRALGIGLDPLRAEYGRAAEFLVDRGQEAHAAGVEQFLRLPQLLVDHAERRAAIAADEAGRVEPCSASTVRCISSRRTSACVPVRKIRPRVAVRLSVRR